MRFEEKLNHLTHKPYHRSTLPNGLTLLCVPDDSTRMACVCILYRVGSRDEHPDKTGIAHLFEHLMFSNCGPGIDFDEVMQNAGAEGNAFTSPDTTQYYNIAPSSCLELMIQMEAIRMEGFKISKKDFGIQQKVVIEEFSEHYLNNPYGLFSHLIMDLSYKNHPYRWPVIGKDREQIAALKYEDAEEFYHRYYHPSNAILVVSGHIQTAEVEALAEKYFGNIRPGIRNENSYLQEPAQSTSRVKTLEGSYPEEALYMAFHAPARKTKEFYCLDMATDILADGKSSLFYSILRKEKMLFSSIDCYLTATTDPGLILIEGKLQQGVRREEAEAEIWNLLNKLQSEGIDPHTWEKYLNKNETAYYFSQVGVINQALNYSYAEWLGDPDLVLHEFENYRALKKEEVTAALKKYVQPEYGNYLYMIPKD